MNISEQLLLLENIKSNFKNKFIEIGANLDDDTPFSQYLEFIKASDNSAIVDKSDFSANTREIVTKIITDSYKNSSITKDYIQGAIKDKYIGTINEKDLSYIICSDKVGITNEKDYVVLNNIIVNDGILDGFNHNKYAVLPQVFTPNVCSWEFVIKVHYVVNNSNNQWLISPDSLDPFGNILFGVKPGGKLYLLLGSDNQQWNIYDSQGEYILESNTDYYFKIQFTGTEYYLYYSIDGQYWFKDAEVLSSVPVYQGQGLALGLEVFSKSSNCYWRGSIDLTQSYIVINGYVWWIGARIIQIL